MFGRACLALAGASLLLSFSLRASAEEQGRAMLVSETGWTGDSELFGGFSGLEVTDGGRGFVALGDRSTLVRGTFARDAEGRITRIEAGRIAWLRNEEGAPLRGRYIDSEGLALHGDRVLVSFESRNRVVQFGPDLRGTQAAGAPDFAALRGNAGLEALAVDGDGRLIVLPERSGRLTRPFPVWRLEDGTWTVIRQVQRSAGFLVAGADVGPDGNLYILERGFNVLGFKTRVRRFALDGSGAKDGEVVLSTATGRHDNLEGLSVWRDMDGAIRLTMVSDDNFNPLQRTEIVEYRIPD